MPEPALTTETVVIDEIAYGGRGVARLASGKVCFVPAVLPGETVRARPARERGGFVEAVATAVLAPSPHRVAPACPLAPAVPHGRAAAPRLSCQGCAYQHAAYPEELRIKQGQLLSLLTRQAGCRAASLAPPVAAPAPLGYRNKIILHAQKDGHDTRLGYFAEDNRTVLDVRACPLAMPGLNALLASLREDRSLLHGLRDGMAVTLRAARDGALWWRGEAREKETWLVENTRLGPLSVPRGSFFQVNPAVVDLLLADVMDSIAACRPRAVMDLYCGVGLFALAAASLGIADVIGADVDGPGIRAADHNARHLGLARIRWLAAPARKALAHPGFREVPAGTLLIVDPPRGGMGRDMVQEILRHPPGHVLYVSCAPDTMARDLVWLRDGGYTVRRARLFDMFPRTPHFETVVTLGRDA